MGGEFGAHFRERQRQRFTDGNGLMSEMKLKSIDFQAYLKQSRERRFYCGVTYLVVVLKQSVTYLLSGKFLQILQNALGHIKSIFNAIDGFVPFIRA